MKIVLTVAYDGSSFHGWQAQENLPTIQDCLTTAVSKIADEPVELFCAGRTDAGVHATQQVVHFETTKIRDLRAWTSGVNSLLPPAIAVRFATTVDDDFHARFSAVARTYHYVLDTAKTRPAIFHNRVTWHPYALDENCMHQAAQYLIGEHDFSAYRSSQCESKTPMRNIQKIKVVRKENYVILEITANAFLHHMVRNIVGVLLKIGERIESPIWAQEILLAKDRTKAAATAPPAGLYLTRVDYPKTYAFPLEDSRILFF